MDYRTCFKEGLPYPYNIADMLLSEMREQMPDLEEIELSASGVMKMMNERLSVREREVIELRWRDGKTCDDCGKVFSVTRERIRQIEAKALKKLSFYARKLEYSSVPYATYNNLKMRYNLLKQQKEQAERRLDILLGIIGNDNTPTEEDELPLTIESMDLSVRAYNCLKRAGIKTLDDLLEIDTFDGFLNIRNLGRKSTDEIVNKIHSYGLLMKWESEEIKDEENEN